MLEITGDHISRLNDTDLRTLVTKLCEAELSRFNLPLSGITAGGDQNAADGGLDVRVDIEQQPPCLDFIPRAKTGFQVKCSDLPPSKILPEMRPHRWLRASISDLVHAQGAYVIVSSQGSTADKALRARRQAMREAIADHPNAGEIHLDFYDRDRLARWVNVYPGVALWLRERIHEPVTGWSGYSNWAHCDPIDSEYLMDDKGRVICRQTEIHEPMPVANGIQAMRAILDKPGGVVRLIGLSGTGKTRLVQALFDSRVGTDALDNGLVLYTDQGLESAVPSAREMLQQLGATNTRAILVVDNCNPVTHRALASAISTYSSDLSLITIEYDVADADDEPEETQVFELEPASEKILEEILQQHAPHLSQLDRHRIASAELSGGNARIALALARTLKRSESLGSLNDLELFRRLFYQRQERSSATLMHVAEVCALVYSFEGEAFDGDAAELPILARLADISTSELYRHLGTLSCRDLLQRRSRWRAILPHAIANRLASQALIHIPPHLITQAFAENGRERLLKSFGRRLSYLHDCDSAKSIAKSWLTGWLSDPAELNELGLCLFEYLAPLAPEDALYAIEKSILGESGAGFVSTSASNRWKWAALLRSIAYDAVFFDRATFLLAKFYAAEPKNYNHNSTQHNFQELFHVCLSGTHALPEQRIAFIRKLLQNGDPELQRSGMEALEAMLKAVHFSSSHNFSFGAHSRDYGWAPGTADEVSGWFGQVASLIRELALSDSPHRKQARDMFSRHFRELWVHANITGFIEKIVKELRDEDGWPDGWIAIRRAIRFEKNRIPPDSLQRLRALEASLRPLDLVQKIKVYVLSDTHQLVDVAETEFHDDGAIGYSESLGKVNEIVEGLGREIANSPQMLDLLLPELLSHRGGPSWQFGKGIAMEIPDLKLFWQQCRTALANIPGSDLNVSLLCGFMESTHRRCSDIACQILDESIDDSILGPFFPSLQSSIRIDESGSKRLMRALTAGFAQPTSFLCLSYGGVSRSITASDFRRIVEGVAKLQNGLRVAVDLLGMRLYSNKTEKVDVDQEILALGRELLIQVDFQTHDEHFAYQLNEIAEVCLQGDDARQASIQLCKNLASALADFRCGAWHYGSLVGVLFKYQPEIALRVFFEERLEDGILPLEEQFFSEDKSPVNDASPMILFSWADESAVKRYPLLAQELSLFEPSDDGSNLMFSPLILQLIQKAPIRSEVLEMLGARFNPRGWSGSLAEKLKRYLPPLRRLLDNSEGDLVIWAKHMISYLTVRIEHERSQERRIDERFE